MARPVTIIVTSKAFARFISVYYGLDETGDQESADQAGVISPQSSQSARFAIHAELLAESELQGHRSSRLLHGLHPKVHGSDL